MAENKTKNILLHGVYIHSWGQGRGKTDNKQNKLNLQLFEDNESKGKIYLAKGYRMWL